MNQTDRRRHRSPPEIVQTSGMDCGPAVLTSMLQGCGISASYARLRDACHTDVDGTSIDDLEMAAHEAGLDVEQVMLPIEQLLLPGSDILPAIVVTTLSGGFTHFVLVWRQTGEYVQLMDPAIGTYWARKTDFLAKVYRHTHTISLSAWQSWAHSESNCTALQARFKRLGLGRYSTGWIANACSSQQGLEMAKLEAIATMAESLCAQGVRPGRELLTIVIRLLEQDDTESCVIPKIFWSVEIVPDGELENAAELVRFRGAVLVRCRAKREDERRSDLEDPLVNQTARRLQIAESETKVWESIRRTVPSIRAATLVVLVVAIFLLVAAGVGESLCYRALLDTQHQLVLPEQRLIASGLLCVFLLMTLICEWRIAGQLLTLGRLLEGRLRWAFYEKMPRLSDQYLATRATSDTAERVHAIHQVRNVPLLAADSLRTVAGLIVTALAIAWFDPENRVIVLLAATCAIVVPYLLLRRLRATDLRVRTHSGALSLFYYDALAGIAPIQSHRGQRAVGREYDVLLSEWARASRELICASTIAEGIQGAIGMGFAFYLVWSHVGELTAIPSALLITYWAMNIPLLGEQAIALIREMPVCRSTIMRIVEPLLAAEDSLATSDVRTESFTTHASDKPASGPCLEFRNVTVQVSGRIVLKDVHLEIPARCHVGVVGASGAGKSTMLGLVLGLCRPTEGQILFDGSQVDDAVMSHMREMLVWVDPAVALWGKSLLANIYYGRGDRDVGGVHDAIREAEVLPFLGRLADGLQTELGEAGRMISGGEGQRVRLARAFLQKNVRLVLLDEAFRGLDRVSRQRLLQQSRERWRDATLLCVTHDVRETLTFDRVIVVEDGRVVEYGTPAELVARSSRYQEMVQAEDRIDKLLWRDLGFRRWTLPLADDDHAHRALSDHSLVVHQETHVNRACDCRLHQAKGQ